MSNPPGPDDLEDKEGAGADIPGSNDSLTQTMKELLIQCAKLGNSSAGHSTSLTAESICYAYDFGFHQHPCAKLKLVKHANMNFLRNGHARLMRTLYDRCLCQNYELSESTYLQIPLPETSLRIAQVIRFRICDFQDKEFLESALLSTVKTKEQHILVPMMKSLEAVCVEAREPTDDELMVMESLEEVTEDMYKADDFIGMNGIKLCEQLIATQNSQLMILTCNTIANISSNNSTFQEHPDGNNLLKHLLLTTNSSLTASVKAKILYAVSCIVSSNVTAIQFIIADIDLGLHFLFNLYTENMNLQIRKRVGRIIGVIFRDISNSHSLNSEQTLVFCRNLIETWWVEENMFAFVNLVLLHSIFIGRNESIRKRLRDELTPQIQEILRKTRTLQNCKDSELAVVRDEEDGLVTLDAFECNLFITLTHHQHQSQFFLFAIKLL